MGRCEAYKRAVNDHLCTQNMGRCKAYKIAEWCHSWFSDSYTMSCLNRYYLMVVTVPSCFTDTAKAAKTTKHG